MNLQPINPVRGVKVQCSRCLKMVLDSQAYADIDAKPGTFLCRKFCAGADMPYLTALQARAIEALAHLEHFLVKLDLLEEGSRTWLRSEVARLATQHDNPLKDALNELTRSI